MLENTIISINIFVIFLIFQALNVEHFLNSPSKVVAKFATKQEIANTYMNKYTSDTYQKFQARMFHQQHLTGLTTHSPQQHNITTNSSGVVVNNNVGSPSAANIPQPSDAKTIEEALGERQASSSSYSSNHAAAVAATTTSVAMATTMTNKTDSPPSSSSSLVSLSPISNANVPANFISTAKDCRKASYDALSSAQAHSTTQLINMMANSAKLEGLK